MADALARIVNQTADGTPTDEQVVVQIFGADLLVPFVERAEVAANDAEESEFQAAADAALAGTHAASAGASAFSAAADATEAEATLTAISAAIDGLPAGTLPVIVATRLLMAAQAGVDLGDAFLLTEAGREGLFIAEEYADHSGVTDTDTEEGLFVRSTNDPDIVFVRKFFGAAEGLWWGATPGVGDTSAAVIAALETLSELKLSGYGYGAGGSISLHYPASPLGAYNCGSALIEINHSLHVFGDGNGTPSGGGTVFTWDDGTGGFLLNDGALVEGIMAVGGFADAEGEYHAFETNSSGKIRDCSAYNWGGDAIREQNSVPTDNSNGFEVDGFFAENCRSGHYAQGGDVNAGKITGLRVKNCRRWGIEQRGFLGKTYLACETLTNGCTAWNTGAAGHPCSYVSYMGKHYFAIEGQEAWAEIHSPSGTTDHNQGWGYWKDGGVETGIPAWFNGINVRSGGGYLVSDLTNKSGFYGCYAEDDQVNQFDQHAMLLHCLINYKYQVVNGVLLGLAKEVTTNPGTGLKIRGTLALEGGLSLDDAIDAGGLLYSFGPSTGDPGNLTWDFRNTAGATTIRFRSYNGGVLSDDGYLLGLRNSGVYLNGDPYAIIRAEGNDVIFCSSGGAAVTGSLTATGKIGYDTGAGGTVTQTTSKSTTVTLNELCGQVTMHNASLAAGALVTFMMNNSQVTSTDMVLVNHVGGQVGYYSVQAINTSGAITFYVRNVSDSPIAEAVILRFLVIKSVNS